MLGERGKRRGRTGAGEGEGRRGINFGGGEYREGVEGGKEIKKSREKKGLKNRRYLLFEEKE